MRACAVQHVVQSPARARLQLPGLYDLWSLLLWPFVEVLLATDDTLKMRAGMNCWYENWEMEVTVKGDVHQEAEDWNLLIFSQQKRCLHWVWTGAKYDFDGQICYCQHPWLLWLPNCHGDSVLRKICGDGIYNLITYHFFGSVMSQSHQPILAIYHAFIWIMQIYFTSIEWVAPFIKSAVTTKFNYLWAKAWLCSKWRKKFLTLLCTWSSTHKKLHAAAYLTTPLFGT